MKSERNEQNRTGADVSNAERIYFFSLCVASVEQASSCRRAPGEPNIPEKEKERKGIPGVALG